MEAMWAAMEDLMQGICVREQGRMYVTREHLARATKTRKHDREIGYQRAEKLRGWIATRLNEGAIHLYEPLEWMGDREREMAVISLNLIMQEDGTETTALQSRLGLLEAQGTVLTWTEENEEPARNGILTLRKERRSQLRTARHRVWKKMGPGSMDAAILTLMMEGRVYPEEGPLRVEWLPAAAREVVGRGWTQMSVTELLLAAQEKLLELQEWSKPRDGGRGQDTILDMGEGWGSIGIAANGMGCATIGADNAGPLYQGARYGLIRARVTIDFAETGTVNLIRRIMKKAETLTSSLLMVWLSPECTLLSRANIMNKTRGCAHGLMAESPENVAAATPERLEEERQRYARCKIAIEQQLTALEEEGLQFALENPQGSQFWELPVVKEVLRRNGDWKVHEVDQCAFGRKAKKPTLIMTNIAWRPRGMTGNGRCKIGKCGGTKGQPQGSRRHEQQTCANESGRATRMGDQERYERGQYSVKAAKNMVASMLVQEIIEAAKVPKRGQTNKKPRR